MLKLFQWLIGSSRSQPLTDPEAARSAARARFEQAFAIELRRVDEERARHANVNAARAVLEARVNDALRRKVSA